MSNPKKDEPDSISTNSTTDSESDLKNMEKFLEGRIDQLEEHYSDALKDHKAAYSKGIGSINGAWQLLFKLVLLSHPFLIGWAMWVTGETFRNKFAREQQHAIMEKIDANNASIQAVNIQMAQLNGTLARLEQLINRLDRLDRLERLDEVE